MEQEKHENVCGAPNHSVLLYCAVDCRDGTLHVEKQILLPFVPWAQLTIEELDATEYEFRIQCVYYNMSNRRFMCRCDTLNGYGLSRSEIAGRLIGCGWSESE